MNEKKIKVKFVMIQYLIDNLCNNHSLISNREKEREEEDKKEKWKNVSRTTATMNAKKAPQWTMNLV